MNNFGDFLYELRKEKGLTQAELAQILGVTNKAVSKWETGEAMPETSLLLPISRIFDVTVDELLSGARTQSNQSAGSASDTSLLEDEIKKHLFTRGKDEPPKSLSEKICGAVCGGVFFAALLTYLLLGAIANLWHPYWVLVPVGALACGIIGAVFDVCNPAKRANKIKKGENPYTGCACAVIILSCIIAYLLVGALANLWHPYWLIAVSGVVVCVAVGIAGNFIRPKK